MHEWAENLALRFLFQFPFWISFVAYFWVLLLSRIVFEVVLQVVEVLVGLALAGVEWVLGWVLQRVFAL
jgi:hypothetical protein